MNQKEFDAIMYVALGVMIFCIGMSAFAVSTSIRDVDAHLDALQIPIDEAATITFFSAIVSAAGISMLLYGLHKLQSCIV